MKNLFFHTKQILLIAFLAFSGIAMAQDKEITREKGNYTFKAATTADAIVWNIDGVEQIGQTGLTFTNSWSTGIFMLSALPSNGGCVGDWYNVKLTIEDDVTKGDTQIVITSPSPVMICPVSNARPEAATTIVELEFRDYFDVNSPSSFNLIDGEEYAVKYSIDDGNPVTLLLDKAHASIVIDTKDYSIGDHTFKILKLAYGSGFRKQRDYTNAQNQPSVVLRARVVPAIGEINIIEE